MALPITNRPEIVNFDLPYRPNRLEYRSTPPIRITDNVRYNSEIAIGQVICSKLTAGVSG